MYFQFQSKASRRKGRGFDGGLSDRDEGDYDRVEEVPSNIYRVRMVLLLLDKKVVA